MSQPKLPLVATPSTYVRNKNILLFLLVAGFGVMFVYDGLLGYPRSNDEVISQVANKSGKYQSVLATNPKFAEFVASWPGWSNATPEQKDEAFAFHQKIFPSEKWHNALDIDTQKFIAIALGGLTLLTIWWFFHCQKRRVTADDRGISPARGVEVPWSAITRIDNTKWKKSGIVWITYKENGQEAEAKLDEYHLDNLRPILQLMEERAPQAEIIAPPGQAAEDAAPNSDEAKKE